jgi:histidinol-phosphate aminotransferase
MQIVAKGKNVELAEGGDVRENNQKLLRLGVIVRPMNGYGLPRHVRISVGLEDDNRALITALRQALA